MPPNSLPLNHGCTLTLAPCYVLLLEDRHANVRSFSFVHNLKPKNDVQILATVQRNCSSLKQNVCGLHSMPLLGLKPNQLHHTSSIRELFVSASSDQAWQVEACTCDWHVGFAQADCHRTKD